jgi:hypothetical protein
MGAVAAAGVIGGLVVTSPGTAAAATGHPGVRLVNHTDSGAHPDGEAYTGEQLVSHDGRFVAFGSSATNLVPGDDNGVFDVFVADMVTGETTRVSGEGGGGPVALASDGSALLWRYGADYAVTDLGDGRTSTLSLPPGAQVREASEDLATLLVAVPGPPPPFGSGGSEWYIADRTSEEPSLDPVFPGGVPSTVRNTATLSADGSTVVVKTDDPAVAPGLGNGTYGVFRRAAGGGPLVEIARGAWSGLQIDASGSTVLTTDTAGVPMAVTPSGTHRLEGSPTDLSADGRYVLIATGSSLGRLDLATGGLDLVGPGRLPWTGTMDDDGDTVTFLSDAPLVPGVVPGVHAYVHEVATGTTELVCCDINSPARTANELVISGDGTRVTFRSEQALDPADTVYGWDLFQWGSPTVDLTTTDVTVTEDAGVASITVSIDEPSAEAVTLQWRGVGDWPASQLPVSNGSVVVPAGATSTTITVPVSRDGVHRPDRSYVVRIAVDEPTALGVAARLTVRNTDPSPVVAIGSSSAAEGSGAMTFTVTLDRPSDLSVTVRYDTATDAEALFVRRAQLGSDLPATSGTVTFAPFETAKTVEVAIGKDVLVELDETFLVRLSEPSGISVTSAAGRGTILDDDRRRLLGS